MPPLPEALYFAEGVPEISIEEIELGGGFFSMAAISEAFIFCSRLRKIFFLLFALIFYFAHVAHSQSGQLDPSFGDKGIVKRDIGLPFEYRSSAKQVFLLPGGKMYVILFDVAFICKRLADGSIDSSYGENGFSRSFNFPIAFAALQTDKKVVITGSSSGSYYVGRLDSTGKIDSTFGNNGLQSIPITCRSLAVQSDGKIIAAGFTDDNIYDNYHSYFSVVRLTAEGNIDNTFNGTGQATADFVAVLPPDHDEGDSIRVHESYSNSVAIQSDGKIVLGGSAGNGDNLDFAVARFKTDGTPDSTFDNDGMAVTSIGSENDEGTSVLVQADNKILLGGYIRTATGNRFAIVRYSANGSADNTFSGDGKQTVSFESDMQYGPSISLQSNNKILIAGYATIAGQNDLAIARLNTNGSLDNTFDADGKVSTDINASDDYSTGSLAIQTDGKIILAGYAYINGINHFTLTKYNSNGSLDNSFDGDGKLIGDFKQGHTEFNATAMDSDGKLVTAGSAWNGTNYGFVIMRHNADGSIDSTFSQDGIQTTTFEGSANAYSIAVQTDGKILVGGNFNPNAYASNFAVARYNTDGTPDNTFGENGKLLLQVGSIDVFAKLVLQADGKIVMTGFSYPNGNYDSAYFSVFRLNTDGSFDNSFSDDGKQITDVGSYLCFASSVNIQSDQKILLSGRSYINDKNHFSMARFNTDGSLDTSFSQDGKQVSDFGNEHYFSQSCALQSDGKILLGGYSQSNAGSAFIVARYLPNGDLDNSFSDDGLQTTAVGPNLNYINAIAVKDDGKIVAGGTNDKFTLVVLNADGSYDNTFSNDGIQVTNFGVGNSIIQALLFSGNNLFATGWGEFPGTMGVIAKYIFAEGGPLPVSLLDFKATLQNQSVLLQWKMATEQNLTKFIIERSEDGVRFMPLNSVDAKSSSAFSSSYSSTDFAPLQRINFYRLKIFEADGKFTYSNVVAVKINGLNKLQLFPNPVHDVLFVQASGQNEKATLTVLDALGKKYKAMNIVLDKNTFFSIDVAKLPAGIFIVVLSKNGGIESQRFLKR